MEIILFPHDFEFCVVITIDFFYILSLIILPILIFFMASYFLQYRKKLG